MENLKKQRSRLLINVSHCTDTSISLQSPSFVLSCNDKGDNSKIEYDYSLDRVLI